MKKLQKTIIIFLPIRCFKFHIYSIFPFFCLYFSATIESKIVVKVIQIFMTESALLIWCIWWTACGARNYLQRGALIRRINEITAHHVRYNRNTLSSLAQFVDEAECCPLFCVVDVAFGFAGTLNGLSFGFRFRSPWCPQSWSQ